MEKTNYTAGFARLDITPFLGMQMAGSWAKRGAQGVLDPLRVSAIAFGDGERSAVLLVTDLLAVFGSLGMELPAKVAESLGLPAEAVIHHCTHTHTGPAVATDPLYVEFLQRRLCDAARMAMEDRKPVTDVQFAEIIAEGMSCTRRFKLSDGTVMTNPAGKWKDMIVDIAGENDESLRLVRILREEAPEIALVNFQVHPDNVGGEYISADFPGVMCRTVEALHPEAYCVFVQGCEGQMVVGDRRTNYQRGSYQKAVNHGKALGQIVADAFDKTRSTGQTGLSYGRKDVRLKTKRDPARVPEAQRIMDLHNAGRDDLIHPEEKFANYIRVEAGHILNLERAQRDFVDTQVCAMTFCGVALAGFPGEPFNEVGKQVRRNSKFAGTFTMALSNGWQGYFPTAQAQDEGGYESYNTPYVRGTAERLADTLDALLKTL